ncbi:MAG: RnfH family protein [Pseudomonadales bacterium]
MADDKRSTSTGGSLLGTAEGSLHAEGSILRTAEGSIKIEVCYGLANEQCLIELQVPVGTTLIEAIQLSGILDRFPMLNIDSARKGIFSQFADDRQVLQAGDRVEIYRPLVVDPMEARRQRAQRRKLKNSGG